MPATRRASRYLSLQYPLSRLETVTSRPVRGASPALRLIERFTRTSESSIEYEVTFVDPDTWTAPWTAAVDLKARPADAGVYEYACHEGNYGMSNMLSASRYLERTQESAE